MRFVSGSHGAWLCARSAESGSTTAGSGFGPPWRDLALARRPWPEAGSCTWLLRAVQREALAGAPHRRSGRRAGHHAGRCLRTLAFMPGSGASMGPESAACVRRSGFFFPTGHPKSEHSGSGLPDRLPVEIGQIQI